MSFFQRFSSSIVKLVYIITSLLGLLVLIPIFLSLTDKFSSSVPDMRDLASQFLNTFVAVEIVYFILSLVVLTFASKLSTRWRYGLYGITTGVGIVYFMAALIWLFSVWFSYRDVEGIGLAISYAISLIMLIWGELFIPFFLGVIGYFLGKKEEKDSKKIQN